MKHFIIKLRLLLLLLLINSLLDAQELKSVINEYDQKNALSQKTIDENRGHLVLFTREKLEKMHAKTLKDVFKTTPMVYYHENRYALPDPMTNGSIDAYKSSFVRIYIDGVEVTQGWMGSGVLLYGDMNIDFVDHIEFYYALPSFDTFIEPSYVTIFIYSKDPGRDNGGKLDLILGSRGTNTESVTYGDVTRDLSYLVSITHTGAKRQKISNGTSQPLNRDFERLQLFSRVQTKNQDFHLQILKKNTHSLAGLSWDATPLTSEINYLNLHMDYGLKIGDNWKATLAYDWLRTNYNQLDDHPIIWARSTP